MCLAVPGRIASIASPDGVPVAEVHYEGGIRRVAQLLYLPDARVGDYILVQAGFAIRRLPEEEALEALAMSREAMARADSSAPA